MDNSLLDIGARCSLPSCPVQDFLPVFCPNCSQYFCQDHIHSDLHSCPAPPVQSDTQHDKLQRCALDDCNKPSLDAYNETAAAACPTCKRSFCAHHRHPVSHQCTSTITPEQVLASTKNEKARALLAKVSSSSTPKAPLKRSTKPPTDPAKLAAYRKVEVMKMRHKSTPLDTKDIAASPPLDQRLHIKVKYSDKEKVFWARKTLIAGKALDLLCDQFGIRQNGTTPTRLFKEESGVQLRNDKLLSEQVDDGSTLCVTRDS